MSIRRSLATLLIITFAFNLMGIPFEQKSADANFSKAPTPSITLSPGTALPNESIAVLGDNFTTGGSARVTSIKIEGTELPTVKINYGEPVDIDSGGNFVAPIVIPVNSTTLAAGSVRIDATDSQGLVATAHLNIPDRTLAVSPESSGVGSRIVVTGENFPVGTNRTGSDAVGDVLITYRLGIGIAKRMVRVATDSSGRFSGSFGVPLDASIPSFDNQVRAYIEGTDAQAVASHSVPIPTIELSPISGPPGTRITVSGKNFPAFSVYDSSKMGAAGIKPLDPITTDSKGGFVASFQVPDLEYASQNVSITVGGNNATASFSVQDFSGETSLLDQMSGNLVRAFHLDEVTNQWSFYDPNPDLAAFTDINSLETGQTYWVRLKTDQTIFVGSGAIKLLKGWNLVVL